MFTSLVLADILILFGFPLIVGMLLIWFSDFMKQRRDDEFLYALDQIINKKDYEKKTGKKTDE